jgi:hypothetical protein
MVDAATQQFTCTEAVKQLRRQIRLNEGDFKQPIEAVQETRKRGWQLALDIDEDYKPELSSHGEVAAAKLGFRVGPENAVAAVARAEQALPESFRERMEQTEVYLSWLDVLDLLETLPDYQEGEAIPPQIYDRFKAILVLPAVVAGAVDAENPDWMSQYVEVVQTGDKYTHRGAQLSAWFSDQRSSDDCFRFKRGLIAVEEALRNGIADEWYSKARRWFRETHMRRFAAVLKMQQMSDVFGFYHLVETGEVAFLNDFIEKRGLTEKELTDLRDFMAEDLGAGFKLFRMYPKLYRVPIDLNDLQTLLETALLPKPESA